MCFRVEYQSVIGVNWHNITVVTNSELESGSVSHASQSLSVTFCAFFWFLEGVDAEELFIDR